MIKQVGARHGHCAGTKEEPCVIEGLRLKATFVLVIYFFFGGKQYHEKLPAKHRGGTTDVAVHLNVSLKSI